MQLAINNELRVARELKESIENKRIKEERRQIKLTESKARFYSQSIDAIELLPILKMEKK
jgi:hypothetical protein